MSLLTADALEEGLEFGAYRIGQCIGRGAMGRVYRAEHSLLKKQVALKVMTSSSQENPAGQHRFIREARAAAAIKHPHVVDILDVGVVSGLPFIVMEFLAGEDLETYLARRGPLPDEALADLALPIIAGIGAVHDAGVIHRDIKPSNIFMSKGAEEDWVPKLLDFGISKPRVSLSESASNATGPGDLMGTPLYMPPEALNGSEYLTAKSDQYSLGLVLYECSAGRAPFSGRDLVSLLRDIAEGNVEPLRRVKPSASPELHAAVTRATSPRPEDRFDHVLDLGKALWGLASERTRHVWSRRFSPGTASLGPITFPRPRSGARLLRPALGVLTVGVAAGAASLWPSSEPTAPQPLPRGSAQEGRETAAPAAAVAPNSLARAPEPQPPARPAVVESRAALVPEPHEIVPDPAPRPRPHPALPASSTRASATIEPSPAEPSPVERVSAEPADVEVNASLSNADSELDGLFILKSAAPPPAKDEIGDLFVLPSRAQPPEGQPSRPKLPGAKEPHGLD